MQQTTCGVIPKKTRVFDRKIVDCFLDESKNLFMNLKDSQYCLYPDMTLISDQALNYLNSNSDDNNKEQLKILLKKEFIDCENIYPYLGDLFVYNYFIENNDIELSDYILFKDSVAEFKNSLKFKAIKDIFSWTINNASLEYTINVQKNILNDIFVEKNDVLNFNLDYDSSFLGGKDFHTMSSYKFIIIDGYIESIGEIHHLLDQANRTKIPHVIFCFGMSEEVNNAIKYNNSQSKFEVMPVVIKFDENTINVLSDIALLHKDHIVSSRSGETISQAVRGDLSVGKEITFHKTGFKITPVASNIDLMIHRNFLNKRIQDAPHEESKKLVVARLKRFSSKSIKIYLPEKVYGDNDFMRELDYVLRFIKHSDRKFYKINFNKRKYFVPKELLSFVKEKSASLKNIYRQIGKLVTYEGN